MTSIIQAQDVAPKVKAFEFKTPPTIDGKLSPGEWDQAPKLDPPLKDIISQKVPKDFTEIWLGYTKKGIYVAFYCHDSEPEKLIGREIIPNSRFSGEDQVILALNAFGNRSYDQISVFDVNLIGTQTERIAGGRTGKREWRGEWQAKTSRVSDGWICEMYIPWSILNYPDRQKGNMDVEFARVQGRTLFVQRWGNIRQNELPEFLGIWEGVEPPKPPKPQPQFLLYSAPEVEDGKFRVRNGLDVRYAYTPSMTGLASFAPDFRNIEDVVAGIDFIRTERFLQETRPFFTEGRGFFDLTGGFSYGSMFYSRRIGPFDAGVKTYGQLTPSLGVGALLTSNFQGQTASVVNANKVFSATESMNVFASLNNQNSSNTSAGFNYQNRKGFWGWEFGSSTEQNSGEKADSAGTAAISYNGKNSFAIARWIYVSPEFNPTLAFIPWTNRRGGYVYANTNWEFRKGAIRDASVFLDITEFQTYQGVKQQTGYSFGANFSTRKDIQFDISKSRSTFSGSLDDTVSKSVTFNVSNRFKRLTLFETTGTQSDRQARFYGYDLNYRLIKDLDISIGNSTQELNGSTRQTIGTIAYQISPLDLVSSRVVWSGAGTNAYLSFRRTGGKGTDLFLILGDPNAPTTQNRVSVKAVWAF